MFDIGMAIHKGLVSHADIQNEVSKIGNKTPMLNNRMQTFKRMPDTIIQSELDKLQVYHEYKKDSAAMIKGTADLIDNAVQPDIDIAQLDLS